MRDKWKCTAVQEKRIMCAEGEGQAAWREQAMRGACGRKAYVVMRYMAVKARRKE